MRLAEGLRSSREAAERLDLETLRAGLDRVGTEVDSLRRLAGVLCGPADAGGGGASALPGGAELAQRLQEAAQEVAALSIVARHGAAVWGHLLGLRESESGRGVYGPAGRLGDASAILSRRA